MYSGREGGTPCIQGGRDPVYSGREGPHVFREGGTPCIQGGRDKLKVFTLTQGDGTLTQGPVRGS